MSISVKKSQHALKIIRRFNEDIFGILPVIKKRSRVLKYLFEIYKSSYKYKKLVKKYNFFSLKKLTRKLIKKEGKFLYKAVDDEKELNKIKKTLKINNYLTLLKLRRFYGNLGKKKLKKTLTNASLISNVLSRSFFYFLESRLDVVLYRANFFNSIFAAKQYINHKKVLVNGIIVNKPGFKLKVTDIVTVLNFEYIYLKLKKKLKNDLIFVNYPKYLEVNYKLGSIIFLKIPFNNEIPFPFFINLSNIKHNFLK